MNFEGVVNNLIGLLQSVVVLLMALAVLFFLWGVYEYLSHSGDRAKRQEGRDFMIYGLIGLFVMVSIWGLVALLTGYIGVPVGVPQLR